MSLSSEWRKRVEMWLREMECVLYRRLGSVSFEGFITKEQLTPQQALTGKFKPMPVGTRWGDDWEYGWLRASVTIPPEAAGKRIVAHLVNEHSLVYVNGQARTSRVKPAILTRKARAGERLDILIEAYAGHPRANSWDGGPVALKRPAVKSAGPTQAIVIDANFGIWNEDIYQLMMDVRTLLSLRDALEPSALRVAKIDAALREMTLVVDLELPEAQLLETVRKGRAGLKSVLSSRNGPSTPDYYAIGHAHLDTAWLWPLAETERKIARTMANQVELTQEYPEHRFILSQPEQYVMLERNYPELYKRVVAAIKKGQVVPEGGMWVESDTNVVGGESLIRQFIHGKRFFKERFGVDSQMLWLPDVFGYCGALPQIMKGCGVKYFTTQKLAWVYHENASKFPYHNFWWQGIDGSEILSFLHIDYNSTTDPKKMVERWKSRRQDDDIETFLVPFGWGDGGSGPERDHLEYVRRQRDLEGVPKIQLASPIEFFKDLEKRGTPNRFVGELYYPTHRGTYTSQARTKTLNRRSEFALRETELWGAAASWLANYHYPLAQMDATWKKVLLNQFHDIIPGSSIQRVYEEAEALYEEVLTEASAVTSAAQAWLVKKQAKSLTVFNSLGWQRTALVSLPNGLESVADAQGNALAVQEVAGERLAEVTVDSCGWATISPAKRSADLTASPIVAASANGLENELLRVKINARGEVTSIYDKQARRELTDGLCNELKLYKDVPTRFDAWDIDPMYVQQPVELEKAAQVEVMASGPLVGIVRVTRMIGQSPMVQEISLRRDERRVDFKTAIDWRERHKLLKAAFAVNVHADEAIHEIQFGHLRRPTHRSWQQDKDRFEVCNNKWTALAEETRGCAILNDCKYGLDVLGNSINLTLLRAPLNPDATADQGTQEFTYSFYCWDGPMSMARLVQEAYELNCPLTLAQGEGGEGSLLSVDAESVVIETVKPAEDGSGDIVVRLYESMRSATRCTLRTNLPAAKAVETNMLEEPLSPRNLLKKGQISLELRPFEIKTLRLSR